MPKVKIIPNKGIRSSRGAGLHLLDSNEKGFGTYIAKASVSLTGTDDADLATGIYIPANATLDKVAIKITGKTVDAAGTDLTVSAIDGLIVNGAAWVMSSGVDLLGGTVGDIVVFCPSAGTATASNAYDALEAQTVDASGGPLTLTESLAGTYTAADDTLGSVEVLVQYTTVSF